MANNFDVLDGGGKSTPESEACEFVMDSKTLIGGLVPADDGGYLVLAPVGHSLTRGEGRARLVELRRRYLSRGA